MNNRELIDNLVSDGVVDAESMVQLLTSWMSEHEAGEFLSAEGHQNIDDIREEEEEKEEEERLQELRDECPECCSSDVEGDDAEMDCNDCENHWAVE